jgi:hypothetical protein
MAHRGLSAAVSAEPTSRELLDIEEVRKQFDKATDATIGKNPPQYRCGA